MMIVPTFLIIGAGRSGTTSLYHYLKQHPEVFMSPIKETHYFSIEAWRSLPSLAPELQASPWRECISTWEEYLALFQGARSEQAVGEASPSYMRVSGVPELIHARLPGVSLIAILRQPGERAFSYYQLMRRNGVEPLESFAAALQAEMVGEPLPDGTQRLYRSAGHYYLQLSRYFDIFTKEQLGIYLYDDLNADAVSLMQQIYGFLGVDDQFVPNTAYRHNESGTPKQRSLLLALQRHKRLKHWIEGIMPLAWQQRARAASKVRATLDPALLADLTADYREDILQLQGLIDRDLTMWLG